MWPQLQPKTWSEAVFKMYKCANHFIIDNLQKYILEAAIDRLDIQHWISRQLMTASKMLFWRLSMIKWCKLLYILRMASDHVLGCSWGHTWLIWMKFLENVGMIPIKICYLMQFLFTSDRSSHHFFPFQQKFPLCANLPENPSTLRRQTEYSQLVSADLFFS